MSWSVKRNLGARTCQYIHLPPPNARTCQYIHLPPPIARTCQYIHLPPPNARTCQYIHLPPPSAHVPPRPPCVQCLQLLSLLSLLDLDTQGSQPLELNATFPAHVVSLAKHGSDIFISVLLVSILTTRQLWHLLTMKASLVYGMSIHVQGRHRTTNTIRGCGLLCTTQQNPCSMHQDQMIALVNFPHQHATLTLFMLLCVIVKMWSANCQRSIFTLETKANVCSVQFHPLNRFYLAFGSAGISQYLFFNNYWL